MTLKLNVTRRSWKLSCVQALNIFKLNVKTNKTAIDENVSNNWWWLVDLPKPTMLMMMVVMQMQMSFFKSQKYRNCKLHFKP